MIRLGNLSTEHREQIKYDRDFRLDALKEELDSIENDLVLKDFTYEKVQEQRGRAKLLILLIDLL